jgi:hypothetical protein
MTNYVDLDELKDRVYFESATFDRRFKWSEIMPDPKVAPVIAGEGGEPDRWADGFRRFHLLDCAHRDVDRDGDLCTHCGHAFEHSPHAVWETKGAKAAKKTTARRRKTK